MQMELKMWLIYMLAVLGLSLTPGPNSLLVLAHGALHGHRKTLWTIAGGALGFVTLIALSMLGISALLQAYNGALSLLKWIGGAYLCWLGLQLWLAPPLMLDMATSAKDARTGILFRQGLFAAISNPKVLLFYGAFLPQFIDPNRSLWTQFVVMAATFATLECTVEFVLANLANNIRPLLNRAGNKFNRVCGVLFALMGAALPMTN